MCVCMLSFLKKYLCLCLNPLFYYNFFSRFTLCSNLFYLLINYLYAYAGTEDHILILFLSSSLLCVLYVQQLIPLKYMLLSQLYINELLKLFNANVLASEFCRMVVMILEENLSKHWVVTICIQKLRKFDYTLFCHHMKGKDTYFGTRVK